MGDTLGLIALVVWLLMGTLIVGWGIYKLVKRFSRKT
jgi:hypothetical protein